MARICDTDQKCPGILDFIANCIGSAEKAILYLRDKKLLANLLHCGKCHKCMRISAKSVSSDGEVWYCTVCKRTNSIRKGSIFQVRKFEHMVLVWYFRVLRCVIL